MDDVPIIDIQERNSLRRIQRLKYTGFTTLLNFQICCGPEVSRYLLDKQQSTSWDTTDGIEIDDSAGTIPFALQRGGPILIKRDLLFPLQIWGDYFSPLGTTS